MKVGAGSDPFPRTPSRVYRTLCGLAEGGMGRVELVARQEGSFRRFYARKRLRESYLQEREMRAMFVDEARIAGLIRHPNVVSVLDVGEDDQGPFLVMDYIEGICAAELIDLARRGNNVLPLQVALRIVMEAAEGLYAAHELVDADGTRLGLIHRDISPQNLLIGFDGVTRVTDFGIAKAAGGSTRTATGVLKGKLGYLSPEQLRFEEPTQRSDLFSLGVVLFELLAGRRLYQSKEGMDGVRRVLHDAPPDVGLEREDAPPEIVALCFALLAKDPHHRPADAREVARVLETCLADLAAVEGRLEVAELLDAAFSEQRRAMRQAIGVALNKQELERARELGRTKRRRVLAAASLAAVLAAGLVVAQAGVLRFTPVDVDSERMAPSQVDTVKVTATATPPPEVEPIEPVDDGAAAPETATADRPKREAQQQRRKASRRARRTARKRSSGARKDRSQGGIPSWEWQ